MANKSKRIGTEFENTVLSLLQTVWPWLTRSPTGSPSNDFTGPFPIEAKRRRRWEIQEWVRKIRIVASSHRWVLFVSPRDLRKKADRDVGRVIVVSEAFGLELLECWWEASSHARSRGGRHEQEQI